MKIIWIILAILLVITVINWCCLSVASDCDDETNDFWFEDDHFPN